MGTPRRMAVCVGACLGLSGLVGCWDQDTSLGALASSGAGGAGATSGTPASSASAGGGASTSGTGGGSTGVGGGSTGVGAGSTGVGGAGGGADPCVEAYPLGPYGQAIGDTWDPALTFAGYPEGSLVAGTIDLTTYYDPHFCKGAGAIVVYEFGTPDVTASVRSGEFVQNRAPGGPWEGVHIVELLVLGKTNLPATLPDALDWKTDPGVDWAIGIDPPPAQVIPEGFWSEQLVIDPCTMKVVMRLEVADIDPTVTMLAARTECPP